MSQNLYLNGRRRLGVLGGGQLGRMLAQASVPLDIDLCVLDPDPSCPASKVASSYVQGSFRDTQAVVDFGRTVDVVTVEIEDVSVEALERLEAEGTVVYPQSRVLKVIQDKGLQKQHYANQQLPTMPFALYDNADDVRAAFSKGLHSLPFVQKSRRAGYDGQGVRVIRTEQQLENLLDVPCVVEDCCAIDQEIAVIVARNADGQVAAFEPIGMVFDPRANLIDHLCYPATLDPSLESAARNLAMRVIESFDMVGLLAVEMFLDKDGRLQINEVAPRPHNSGHQTIESCETSQYEQHLRAVFNLPLGSTRLKMPSLMLNLLGEPGHSGPAYCDGMCEALALPGVKVHLYGKSETRPFRKMGHVTIVAPSLAEAWETSQQVRSKLKIVARAL